MQGANRDTPRLEQPGFVIWLVVLTSAIGFVVAHFAPPDAPLKTYYLLLPTPNSLFPQINPAKGDDGSAYRFIGIRPAR